MTRRLFWFHTTRCFLSHLSCKPLQLLVRGVGKKSLAQKCGIGWGRQRIRQGYSKLPYIFTVRRVGEPRERRGFHGDKVDKCGNADWNKALKTSDQSSVSKGCICAYSHNSIFFLNLALLSLYHSFIACQSDQQITRSNNSQDSPLNIWWSIPFTVAFVAVFTEKCEHTFKKNDLVSFFCSKPFQISLVLQSFLETCQRLFRRLDFMVTRKPRKNIWALL